MLTKLRRYMYLRQTIKIKEDRLRDLELDCEYLTISKKAKTAEADIIGLRINLAEEQKKKDDADMVKVREIATKIADRENTAKGYVNGKKLCGELKDYIKLLNKWKDQVFNGK